MNRLQATSLSISVVGIPELESVVFLLVFKLVVDLIFAEADPVSCPGANLVNVFC